MRCLADNGRLLEIGKYDILKGTPLSMRPMLRNCAFEGIDLDRIVNDPSNITEVQPDAMLLSIVCRTRMLVLSVHCTAVCTQTSLHLDTWYLSRVSGMSN